MKLFAALTPGIIAHSWIACTDYAEKNAADYDHAKCRGWPRKASQFAPIGGNFGQDSGYDTRPQSGTSPCKTPRTDDDYTGGHFKAIYFPGQQVILAHPMKNHGTGTACTNKFIPDNGNWLYSKPETRVGAPDPVLSEFKENEIVNLGISPFGFSVSDDVISSYPKVGFSNAPKFCDDTGNALATYSFNVPADMEIGEHTFVWLWAFNSATDYYSTCFEVEMVADADARETRLAARGQSDFSLICDSSGTSESTPGSTTGCKVATETPVTQAPVTQAPATGPSGTEDTENEHDMDAMGYVLTNQMTGNIILPSAEPGTTSREIHVKFYATCASAARPNFWYATLDYTHDDDGTILNRFRRDAGHTTSTVIHYVLVQDNSADIDRGYVGFHWALDGGCRMLDTPTQVHAVDTSDT